MVSQTPTEYGLRPNTLTIPELEQSKAAALNTLASVYSRRSYTFAIDRFIAWYCSEPRLTFNRAVVVRYRVLHSRCEHCARTSPQPQLQNTFVVSDCIRAESPSKARASDASITTLRRV